MWTTSPRIKLSQTERLGICGSGRESVKLLASSERSNRFFGRNEQTGSYHF